MNNLYYLRFRKIIFSLISLSLFAYSAYCWGVENKPVAVATNNSLNLLIKGRMVAEPRLKDTSVEERTYYFNFLLADNSYSIHIYDSNHDLHSETFNDGKETITLWASPESRDINSDKLFFKAVFSTGICPYGAGDMATSSWMFLPGRKRGVLESVFEEYPPGIIFENFGETFYNWYDFSYTTEYINSETPLLKKLKVMSPPNTLMTKEELVAYDYPEEVINSFPAALDGRLIVPGGATTNDFLWLEADCISKESALFPEEVVIKKYTLPSPEGPICVSQRSLFVDSTTETNLLPKPPEFPNGTVRVRDFRPNGMTNKALRYALVKGPWPFANSPRYQNVVSLEKAQSLSELSKNFGPSNSHVPRAVVIIILFILPITVFLLVRKASRRDAGP